MEVLAGALYEAVVEWGTTGETIGLTVIDNEDHISVARVTGFSEYPAGSGIYQRAGNIAPTVAGDYSLVYDDDGGTAAPGHVAVEDLTVIATAVSGYYATVDELARILKLRNPSLDQQNAMIRVLTVAAGEINAEVDLGEDDDALAGWQLALVAEVNLERAVEHWQQEESPFGILGLGDGTAMYTARDSWNRHALKLAPIKAQWGLA